MITQEFIHYYLPFLLKGTAISLEIALCGCLLGICIGTILAAFFSKGSLIARICAHIYVTIIRGTPMLLQVMVTYYMLKKLGFGISPFWSAILSIGCNSGAYLSQIILSGINSIPAGQSEAAQVLGFSKYQTLRYIILPQAITSVIPSLGNEFVTLIKDSSLASIIGVYELSKQGEIIMSKTYNAPAVYLMVGCIYLLLTTTLTLLINYLDKKMQTHVRN